MTLSRRLRGTQGGRLVVAVVLIVGSATPAAAKVSGTERFDGGLVVSGAAGKRKVVGSVIAAQGVFTGVGRIVERPNRPGDSGKVSRDDLVFADGTLHIVNVSGRALVQMNRRTCKGTMRLQQTTTIDGGTRRFAGATGRFTGTVSGTAVAGRKRDGSCDQQHLPLIEIDTVTGSGTLSF